MESTFILILMSAGVLVAVLGAILFTSERELKSKRRQIEELLTKLESAPQGSVITAALPNQAESGAELTEIKAQNRDLQNQLQALSAKLELREKTIDELQAKKEKNSADSVEIARLQAANDQLQAQLAQLRDRLAATEAEIQSSAGRSQDSQDRHARLQAEVAELKQQLDARQETISALETAQLNLPDVAAIEANHRQERQAWQQRINELEQRRLADQELIAEAQTLRQRLIAAEESQQSLRDEMQRHEKDIPRWQARVAEGEEHRQRLAALRAPLDALLSKEALLAEQQRRLQEDLSAFARMMSAPLETATRESTSEGNRSSDPSAFGVTTNQAPSLAFASSFKGEGEIQTTQPIPPTPATDVHESIAAAGEPETRRRRRYGIFGLLIVLVAGGAAAFYFFGSEAASIPAATATANVVKPAAVPLQPKIEPVDSSEAEPAAAAASVSEASPVKQASAKRPVDNSDAAPPASQAARIEPRLAGTFQITRPGRVYAAPSEASRPIGDIEPGVKVNVVDSRNGWLEIHSKHGRPPGFIRHEFATRVSGQN